jgi:hypothetical protein
MVVTAHPGQPIDGCQHALFSVMFSVMFVAQFFSFGIPTTQRQVGTYYPRSKRLQ